jgi:hypothetical protein
MGCPIIQKIKPTLDKWFGLPNEGIHSYKIYDIAYLDFIVTMVAAYFMQKLFLRDTSYSSVLLGLFLLGIVVHRVLNVGTGLDKILFPDAK